MRQCFVSGVRAVLASLLLVGCPPLEVDPPSPIEPGPGSPDAGADMPDAPVAGDMPDAPMNPDFQPDGPPTIGDIDAPVLPPPPPPIDAPPAPPPGTVNYGPAEGLAGPILDVSTDDAHNVWAINANTLYLLTPGAPTFVGFNNSNGLHVENFTDVNGNPAMTTLTAVAGAGANELYLGYFGYEGSSDPFTDTPEQKALGNGDHIHYDPATGQLSVLRYQFKCIVEVSRCWEDRSVRRIIVGHSGVGVGHAFFGFNHGTTHVFNDVLGDHVHPEVVWHNPDGSTVTRYGECWALALNDDGTLWIGNRYGFGLMNWNPDPIAWVSAKFKLAYTTYTPDHSLDVSAGYSEDNRGAAVTADGSVWFASDSRGLASWNPTTKISTLRQWAGSSAVPQNLVDVVADTDGTIWLVTVSHQLLHLDPATGAVTATDITDAQRMYLDKTVSPRALYVARTTGITVFH